MPSTKLHVKPKDDIVIKLTECLDKSGTSTNMSNEARAINHGHIFALKWVLGYDELHKSNNEDKTITHIEEE